MKLITKRKISDALRGRKRPPRNKSWCKKLSLVHLGKKRKPFTKLHIKRLREANLGNKNPMYGTLNKDTHKRNCKCAFCRDKSGSNNNAWVKGVPINYTTLHRRIQRLYGKASHCESLTCKHISNNFVWANKKHDYKTLNRKDWKQLCRSCHEIYDRLHNDKPKYYDYENMKKRR